MMDELIDVSSPHIPARLSSLIWSFLDSGLSRTALFYSERFFALDNQNHNARHLYCQSLIEEKQYYSALALVNNDHLQCGGCLELKARCCTILGRHRQAHEALEQTLKQPSSTILASSASRTAISFPSEAALHCRSGNMSLKGRLPESARASFREALRLNPMIWEAFEGLCTLGDVPPIDELFPPKPLPVKRPFSEDQPILNLGLFHNTASFSTPESFRQIPFPTHLAQPQPFRFRDPPFGPRDSLASTSDSSFQLADVSFPHLYRHGRPPTSSLPAPSSQFTRPLSSADETGPDRKKLRSNSSKMNEDSTKRSGTRPATSIPSTSSRRSNRLMSTTGSKSSKIVPTRERRRQLPVRSQSPDSDQDEDFGLAAEATHSPSPPPGHHPDVSPPLPANHEQLAQQRFEEEQADFYIYDLVRRFARAAGALAHYQCQACIDELNELSPRHQQSPYVLTMVGRANYEKLDYASAERAFQSVRSLDPYRIWDMEVYSTLLWHLQRSVELSFLAQELLNIDPSCPQTWIAIGNLFSLQKERSQAMTCFRRATELDPSCAYAYTLSGHECIDEDLNKSIQFFQQALRADPRHYNAWYGLGTCYMRMSKIRLAEYHYCQSVKIHSTNAVLLGCVGMTMERKKDFNAALSLFNKAVEVAPDNALVRYRRAKLLIRVKKFRNAITDLEMLRNATPEEANVVFQLAKVYRLIGDDTKSAQTLAIVRDMAPKHLSKIKKLLETVRDGTYTDPMEEG